MNNLFPRNPLVGGDDPLIPDGFTSLICAVDPHRFNLQASRAGDSYFRNKFPVRDRVFDINRGDIVWGINTGTGRELNRSAKTSSRPGAGVNEAIVGSALNGIEGLLEIQEDMKMNHELLECHILSRLSVFGLAYTAIAYNNAGETSRRGFAVQCGGVVTRAIHQKVNAGEMLRWGIPDRDSFSDHNWRMEQGEEPSKIGLVLKPVTEVDVLHFTLRCYVDQRRYDEQGTNSPTSTQFGLVSYARGLEHFALMCGLNLLYRLMQYGIVGVETPIVQRNATTELADMGLVTIPPAAGPGAPGGLVYDKIIKTQKHNTAHATFTLQPHGTNKQLPGFPDGTQSGGHVFSIGKDGVGTGFKNFRRFADRGTVTDLSVYDRPEQVVMILANIFRLVDTRPDAESPNLQYRNVLNAMNDEDNDLFLQCKATFLDSVFQIENKIGFRDASGPKDYLEFGYNNDPARRLAKRQIPGNMREGIRYVSTTNGAQKVDDLFFNTLRTLVGSLSTAAGLYTSNIAGKALRTAEPDVRTLDMLMW